MNAESHLKELAKEYAKLIVTENNDEAKILSIREEMGFNNDLLKESNKIIEPIGIEQIKEVGIWKEQIIDGKNYYVKNKKYSHEFQEWARVDKIPPKNNKIRIAFLGESVARGFLYDPYFTPASELENVLNENLCSSKTEVIDLARTSIKIEQLQDLCLSCVKLQPDLLVVFAGNNWRESLLHMTDNEFTDLYEAMNNLDAYNSVQTILHAKYTKLISSFTETLNNISKDYSIPVVLIIPEFNLKDWKSNSSERDTMLFVKDTNKWLELKNNAEKAFLAGDLEMTEVFAKEMIILNQANPLAYELLAECNQRKGLIKEARENLEAARDTSLFRFGNTPVCISFIRDILLKQAEKYNFKIIDLPGVFAECLKGGIPGNDFFIDYCHLTIEGIYVAIKYTAKCILDIIENADISIDDIKMPYNDVDNVVKGKAHFFAAIHCAHRGEQHFKMLLYHCSRAISYSKEIIDLMQKYIDMATRKVPWIYNKNYAEMIMDGLTIQYPVLMQNDGCKIMDIDLVNAMLDVLKSKGIDIKDDVDKLRLMEHSEIEEQIDLLETYYRETSYINSKTVSNQTFLLGRCYYTSFCYKSLFYLVVDHEIDIILDLTFRNPMHRENKKELEIKVNNIIVTKTVSSDKWKDLSIKVDKSILKEDGVNRIEILWPFSDLNKKIWNINIRKYNLIWKYY